MSALASEQRFATLKTMIPNHVVLDMVTKPGDIIAMHSDRASVLFVRITDFDDFAGGLSPASLLAFLNNIFMNFDAICVDCAVQKIETVAGEYSAFRKHFSPAKN